MHEHRPMAAPWQASAPGREPPMPTVPMTMQEDGEPWPGEPTPPPGYPPALPAPRSAPPAAAAAVGPPPAPQPPSWSAQAAAVAGQEGPFADPSGYAPSYAEWMQQSGVQATAEAAGDVAPGSSHFLGLSTIVAGVGGVIGWRIGGVAGSVAGGLVGGALVNAYRAVYYYQQGTDEGDHEAGVSATYAILSGAIAAYVAAKHVEPRYGHRSVEATPNPDDEDGDDDEPPIAVPLGPCASRRVGPRVVPTRELLAAAERED